MSGEKELRKAYESILGQHYEEAVEWFQKAIEQDPGNGDYHYKLSITYARSGRIEEALAQAKEALRLDRGNVAYESQVRSLEAKRLCQTAEKLMEAGPVQDRLAVSHLRSAIKLDPLEDSAYVLLAAAYARMKEYKDAIATLRELLELDPEHKTAAAMLEEYKRLFIRYLEEPQ